MNAYETRERDYTYVCVRSLYNDIFDYERTLCDSLMLKVNSAADELVKWWTWVLHIAKVGSIPSPYLVNVEEQKS